MRIKNQKKNLSIPGKIQLRPRKDIRVKKNSSKTREPNKGSAETFKVLK
jgi:hypothetical protein